MASITFFCCSRNLSSLSRISSSFCLTSSGSLPPGRFFISASTSAWACRVTSKQLPQHVDDPVLRGGQLRRPAS